MFFNGHRRKKEDYNRRADSAKVALAGAIDYTRTREAASATGTGESSSITIPDLLEPIYAYRAFGVCVGGFLYSPVATFMGGAFAPGKPKPAICGKHPAPYEFCSCGFYTSKCPVGVMSGYEHNYQVVGRVAIWGRVIEHDGGYRSEYCYPVELKIFTNAYRYTKEDRLRLKEIGMRVEENYGAHVVGSTNLMNVYSGNY